MLQAQAKLLSMVVGSGLDFFFLFLKGDELLAHAGHGAVGENIFSHFLPKYQLGGWGLCWVTQHSGTVRQLGRPKGRKKLGGKSRLRSPLCRKSQPEPGAAVPSVPTPRHPAAEMYFKKNPKVLLDNLKKILDIFFFFCSCVCFKLQKFLKGKFIGFRCYFGGFCNSKKGLYCPAEALAAAGPALPMALWSCWCLRAHWLVQARCPTSCSPFIFAMTHVGRSSTPARTQRPWRGNREEKRCPTGHRQWCRAPAGSCFWAWPSPGLGWPWPSQRWSWPRLAVAKIKGGRGPGWSWPGSGWPWPSPRWSWPRSTKHISGSSTSDRPFLSMVLNFCFSN